jgi:heavy metal translocating P-type ATPase
METLISIGAASAFSYSFYNWLAGSIHLYFDTASMLITLVLLGKMIERSARDRMREDLSGFFSLRPTKARLCTPDSPDGRYVSADLLRPGDVVAATAGEIAAADGIVLSGEGRLDESSLTGEPRPVKKAPGDRVRSGTRLLSGHVRFRAERVGEASLLGQMITIMEGALGKKTSLEGRADRLLRWFAPAILLLAVATAAGCLMAGAPAHAAFVRAVTVLVIACPCSLGIAIPMARAAGLSLAARNGLVVRDFSAFEAAATVDAVVFDKTGTLTEGAWTLERIRLFGNLTENEALALAAGLEVPSDHTVAGPIREEARRRVVAPAPLSDIRVQANGISACFDGRPVRIGAGAFVGHKIAQSCGGPATGPAAGEKSDISRVLLSLGEELCAVFEFGDSLRGGAVETIRRLHAEGHRVAVISGDGDAATRKTAARLGVTEAAGGMLPHDKAAFVSALQTEGYRVAMVGDGINDAPALARSDLAVAVHAGSRLGREAADVTLMRGEPQQILRFFELAGYTRRKIHQNLWCAFVYNTVSIPVAMSGLLNPLVAVCAMLLSSLTVIGNTLRLSGESTAGRRRVDPAPAELLAAAVTRPADDPSGRLK